LYKDAKAAAPATYTPAAIPKTYGHSCKLSKITPVPKVPRDPTITESALVAPYVLKEGEEAGREKDGHRGEQY